MLYTTTQKSNTALLATGSSQDNQILAPLNGNFIQQYTQPVNAGSAYITIGNGVNDQHGIAADDASQVSFSGSGNGINDIVEINPRSDLSAGSQSYVQFADTVFRNVRSNFVTGINDSATLNVSGATADTTPPKPISATPGDDAQQVAVDSDISVRFDENIKPSYGSFIISNGQGDIRTIAASDPYQVSINNNTVTINPYDNLWFNTTYTVQMTGHALTDLAGNAAAAVMDQSTLNFKTVLDTLPPIPLSSEPYDDAQQVPLTGAISGIFNEAIKAGNGNIIISNGAEDTRIIATADTRQVLFNNEYGQGVITVQPNQAWLPGSRYTVQVDNDAILDLSGNPYGGAHDTASFNFETAPADSQAPALTQNLLVAWEYTDTAGVNPSTFSIPFNEAIKAGSGSITISNGQGDTQKIAIHDNSQIQIYYDSVTVTPSGGLLVNSAYSVQIDSGAVTDLAGNRFAGVTGTEALLLKTTPVTITDNTPPKPISANPQDEASEVPVYSDIEIKFDEDIKAGSGHFIISNGQGDTRVIPVGDSSQVTLVTTKAGDMSGPVTDYTRAIINPTEDLLANSQYYVQMESGTVTDNAGNPAEGVMDSTTLNFTTGALDTTPPSLQNTQPADDDFAVPVDTGVSLTFDEGILVGTGYLTLSDGQGDVRNIDIRDGSQVSFNDRSIGFHPTEPLHYHTAYFVQLDPGAVTDLSGNPFTGITSPLQFNFATVKDDGAPQLISVSPSDYAQQVPVDSSIYLTFNEAVKAGAGHIIISNAQNSHVAIDIQDTSQIYFGNNYLNIYPHVSGLGNSSYSVQIEPGAITDLTGNAFAGLDDANALRFGTDSIGPRVLFPYDPAPKFADGVIFLRFNEEIKAGSGYIVLSNDQGDIRMIDVNDLSQVSVDYGILAIQPNQALISNSAYSIQLDDGVVTDKAGNPLSGEQNTTAVRFETAGKTPAPAVGNPVTEIDHGGVLGRYENGDILVFHFNEPVSSYRGFLLDRNEFGGNDVVLSQDGLSASVELDQAATVAHGDLITFLGVADSYDNFTDVHFTL